MLSSAEVIFILFSITLTKQFWINTKNISQNCLQSLKSIESYTVNNPSMREAYSHLQCMQFLDMCISWLSLESGPRVEKISQWSEVFKLTWYHLEEDGRGRNVVYTQVVFIRPLKWIHLHIVLLLPLHSSVALFLSSSAEERLVWWTCELESTLYDKGSSCRLSSVNKYQVSELFALLTFWFYSTFQNSDLVIL